MGGERIIPINEAEQSQKVVDRNATKMVGESNATKSVKIKSKLVVISGRG